MQQGKPKYNDQKHNFSKGLKNVKASIAIPKRD